MTRRIKYSYLAFFSAVISALVHNSIFALLKEEEWFFFGLSILSAIAFSLLLLYNLMEFIITKEPADLWKLGFLGLFGLLGLIPGLTILFSLFSLFSLFGTREYI